MRWQAQRDTAFDRPNKPSAVTRSAGLFRVMDRDPGAHAPGFMLSCATRTVLLKNRKIASLTHNLVLGVLHDLNGPMRSGARGASENQG